MLRQLLLCLLFFTSAGLRAAEEVPLVEIYMPSPCLACIDWGSYLTDNGFKVSY